LLVRAVGVAVLITVIGATPAYADRGGDRGQGGSSTPTGIDVSYPQCPATSLPKGKAFAVVGVNHGLANNYNSCLATEFGYAQSLTATTTQPVAQLYVNTGDPSDTVADWPYGSNGAGLGNYGVVSPTGSTPYGNCTGYAASPACAYVYGYDMVAGDTSTIVGDVADFEGATGESASAYRWWLDVETANSWQQGTAGQQMNVADLQGMVAALHAADHGAGVAAVGIYSTSSQWGTITGTPEATFDGSANTLWGLADWVPGARSLSAAQANCGQASFSGSKVALTQWVSQPDGDYSCP
jgi:hypothetical protein